MASCHPVMKTGQNVIHVSHNLNSIFYQFKKSVDTIMMNKFKPLGRSSADCQTMKVCMPPSARTAPLMFW